MAKEEKKSQGYTKKTDTKKDNSRKFWGYNRKKYVKRKCRRKFSQKITGHR